MPPAPIRIGVWDTTTIQRIGGAVNNDSDAKVDPLPHVNPGISTAEAHLDLAETWEHMGSRPNQMSVEARTTKALQTSPL